MRARICIVVNDVVKKLGVIPNLTLLPSVGDTIVLEDDKDYKVVEIGWDFVDYFNPEVVIEVSK